MFVLGAPYKNKSFKHDVEYTQRKVERAFKAFCKKLTKNLNLLALLSKIF